MSCIPIQDFSLISLCDATKAGKLYSIVPDTGAGDFDVTRASTATYLGSDGLLKTAATDEPRIEFNPDGSYKGLLVEPAATNLVLRSEEFDDAYWTKINGTVTANDAVAPDGTMTADYVEQAAGETSRGGVFRNLSITSGQTLTFSVFAKKSDNNILQLGAAWFATFGVFAVFDLDSGTILSVGANITAKMEDYGNGWFRCSITGTTNQTGGRNHFIYQNTSPTATPETGIFIWGAQLETGTAATSYIPTVASTVTRAADVIRKTGASALIGQTEGTVYMEVDLSNLRDKDFIIIDNGLAQDFIIIGRFSNGNFVLALRRNFVTSVVINSNVSTGLGRFKIGVSYESGNQVMYVNGQLAGTATHTTNFPTLTLSRVSLHTSPYSNINDHIKAAALLPTRLSNAQLEALTTL